MLLTKTVFALAGLTILAAESSATTAEGTSTWRKSLVVDITTTQTSYSDSWAGGEAGSVNWVGNLNGSAEKQIIGWFALKSTLKLSFGQTLTQSADSAKRWSKPRKSTDLIDWENVGRYTLHALVDPYTAFRIETQFVDASFEAKMRYFSPVKLTASAGITRRFYEKDNDYIATRTGLGLRRTVKTVIIDSLTFATTDSTFTDGGLESVTDIAVTVNEMLSYTGKLTLYKALYFSKKNEVKGTEFENDWKAVDINWENIVSASLSKIVTVNLYAQLLYDREVSRRGRLKETLAIGFVFKML